MKISVDLDGRSKRIVKRLQKILPTRQIRAGMNFVVGRELKSIRAKAVTEAAAKTPLKPKFIKKWSGADKARKGSGAVWTVARNIRLDRAGAVTGRGGNVRATKGRILNRVVVARDGTFIIGKHALRRDNRSRKLRHYWLPTHHTLKRAYLSVFNAAPRLLDKAIHREMRRRLKEWRAKVKR